MKPDIEKTYGVVGMLEWHTVIRCGHSSLRVRFEGGALSGYGVTPAEFTTSNRVAQHIIENSKEFKSGRIRILRSRRLESEEVETLKSLSTTASVSGRENGEITIRNVHLSCREDAREWLIKNCNVAPSSLRGYDSVKSHAALHGINFIFDGNTSANAH